ncbi:MAG: RNA-binding S4 domain-containing protein [Clostridia bacterium]|nr:RNA-binding S4 domain-containing protein [Clostridia bacterium]
MQKKIKVKVKVAEKNFREVKITTDDIRLDAALKLSSAVSTGGQAKMVIQDNMVKVNGDVCTIRGKKLFDGDEFSFDNKFYKIVKE